MAAALALVVFVLSLIHNTASLEDPGFYTPFHTPCWIQLPWNEVPGWGLITRAMQCRLEMDIALRTRGGLDCSNSSSTAFGMTLKDTQKLCATRIAIISMHAGAYAAEAKHMAYHKHVDSLKDKYCARWGYCDHLLFIEPRFPERYRATERRRGWWKLLTVMYVQSLGQYDWYMWMDSDAALVDHSIDLRMLMAPEILGSTAQLVISKDPWPTPGWGETNTGVWAIRNGSVGAQLLEDWWKTADDSPDCMKYKETHPWEQAALNTCMFTKYGSMIALYPHCWLSGHPWALIDRPFVAHLAGISDPPKLEERLRYFTYWDGHVIVSDYNLLQGTPPSYQQLDLSWTAAPNGTSPAGARAVASAPFGRKTRVFRHQLLELK